jgi:hypothetical protein
LIPFADPWPRSIHDVPSLKKPFGRSGSRRRHRDEGDVATGETIEDVDASAGQSDAALTAKPHSHSNLHPTSRPKKLSLELRRGAPEHRLLT